MSMRVLALAAAAALFAVVPADAQSNRRDRQDPELVLQTGGRTGRCDNLLFTPDGKQLIAVGDDKVVRVWPFADGKIDPAAGRVLRWPVWREQRGSIYALAVSPDGSRVAIGGLSAAPTGYGTVYVLDLADGRVLGAAVLTLEHGAAVWAAAFSPSGKRVAFGGGDGSVWLWDFQSARKLGVRSGDRDFNTVRLLRFTGEDRLLSLAEDGQLVEWNAAADPAVPSVVLDVKPGRPVFRAEMDRDGRWLAAAVQGPLVRLVSLSDKAVVDIRLENGEFPRALAFDPKENRLAVAAGSLVPGATWHIEGDDRIVFYDLSRNPPTPTPGPKHAYRADRLTFQPDGGFLAVAGGDNHEVTLWDLARPGRPASVVRGVGSCLWDVALSQDRDSRAVGIRMERDPGSADPNARGKGPWRVFDLPRRLWVAADDFKPVPRLASAGGWTVAPDAADPYVWYAVHESGVRLALPLDRDRDGMPRCYTFLSAQGEGAVRLAVGHYWGLSVFELTAKEVRRVRWCVGHQGEVTALAPSADGTWLVSCSDDMTLAAWSMAKEWPSQPILGASFEAKGAGLVVKSVDSGSPAWEAGLVAQDEVVRYGFGGRWMDNAPAAWLDRLTHPAPGLENAFDVVRDKRNVTEGGKKPLVTTLKQRPLWKLFPAGDEWVLWMWRKSYYDSSPRGDQYLGWHVNGAEKEDAPAFYPLDKFSGYFRRLDVIKRLINARDVEQVLADVGDDPAPRAFDEIEPPAARLELADARPGQDIQATLSVGSPGDNPDQALVSAELWLNDYRVVKRGDVEDWPKAGRMRTLSVTIPYAKLRAGPNVVTFQTWNRLGGRAEDRKTVTCGRRPPAAPLLVGLAVGINNYGAARPGAGGKGALHDLKEAVNDADALAKAWENQKLYGGAKIRCLRDMEATQTAILDGLDRLKDADPDDLCVVFLSGHGYGWTEPPQRPGGPARDMFAFCLPDFDPDKPYTTGITSEVLLEKLAAIPCRKLVFLDACHSGGAASEDSLVRRLAPEGQGPVVMAACDRAQESVEDERFHHGLFTYAVLEALGEKFAEADGNGDKVLDVGELYAYTRGRVPKLLVVAGRREGEQVPALSSPGGENFPIAKASDAGPPSNDK